MRKLLLLSAVIAVVCLTACAQKKETKAMSSDKKVLVAYFSATGVTADAARKLAAVTGGDLCEIAPEKPYTAADLDWRDKESRCYVEMHDLKYRPALKATKENVGDYDVIYVGFPIWWNIAPTIVNTFIEAHALEGKTVVPFATSGGSTIANSVRELRKAYPGIEWRDGRLLNRMDEEGIRQWVEGM